MAASWTALRDEVLADLNAGRVLVAGYTTPTGQTVTFRSLRQLQDYIDWIDGKIGRQTEGIPTNLAAFS